MSEIFGFLSKCAPHPTFIRVRGRRLRILWALCTGQASLSTLNTDNRLMSRTSLSDEFRLVAKHQGFERSDLLTVTEHAMMAAFAPLPVKHRILDERIRPAYA